MIKRTLSLIVLVLATSACTFHTTATSWNSRVGADGKPVHLISTTKVGLKTLIFLPLVGDMEITGMVNDITEQVKAANGDKVRVFQAAQDNYWWIFPPISFFISPVISTISADYEISPADVVPSVSK